ncbi:bcl-2-like protein 11 [Polymixia lowei]
MSDKSRPRNRFDGSSAVTERVESGEESVPVGVGGGNDDGAEEAQRVSRSKQANDSGAPSDSPSPASPPSPGGFTNISQSNSLGGYQSRSPLFRYWSRSSSGYFSFDADSQPNSPFLPRQATADKATQTPSPSSQVITHVLQRMSEAHGGAPGEPWRDNHHGSPTSLPSLAWHPRVRPRNTAENMQQEVQIGRNLRRIGDQFNDVLMQRQPAGWHGRAARPRNPLPHNQQGPALLLFMGLIFLLIGRLIYVGSTDSHHDHSEV